VASRYAISGPVFAQVEPWQACCLHSSRTIAVNTGISGRKKSTQIAGLPQLFTAKGHETLHHWVHDRLRQLGHVPPNSWLRYRRDDVGLVLEDAAEHYDGLNTLADITGVPEGGFLQDGAGRSLKRYVPFGERFVFSNELDSKMSVVRGHERLRSRTRFCFKTPSRTMP
jgi:hypothetical protein